MLSCVDASNYSLFLGQYEISGIITYNKTVFLQLPLTSISVKIGGKKGIW